MVTSLVKNTLPRPLANRSFQNAVLLFQFVPRVFQLDMQFDALEQRAYVQRLSNVVHRAKIEPAHLVVDLVEIGQYQRCDIPAYSG